MAYLPSVGGNGQLAVFVQMQRSHDVASIHKCSLPCEVRKSNYGVPRSSACDVSVQTVNVSSVVRFNIVDCVRSVLSARFSRSHRSDSEDPVFWDVNAASTNILRTVGSCQPFYATCTSQSTRMCSASLWLLDVFLQESRMGLHL